MTVPVTVLAGMARARRMLGGKAASRGSGKGGVLAGLQNVACREIMAKPYAVTALREHSASPA